MLNFAPMTGFSDAQRDVERRLPAPLATRPLELKLGNCVSAKCCIREAVTLTRKILRRLTRGGKLTTDANAASLEPPRMHCCV